MPTNRLVKVLGPIVIVLLSLFVANQVMQSQPPVSMGQVKQVNPLLVDVLEISEQTFQIEVESYAALKANTRTDILPLVSGQVVKVSSSFQRGAFVTAGQLLLEIDPLEYEVAVQVARSELASAELALAEEEARSEQAERDWRHSQNQSKAQVSDFALRYPQLKAAKANLATAEAKLQLAMKNLDRTKVRAPYGGRLIETFVNLGSVVSTATRLAELYSSESLELSLPIANRDLQFLDLPTMLNNGDIPVRIENPLVSPSQYWRARIVGTEALVDSENQQIYAVAKIKGPENSDSGYQALKVGQYLHAVIEGKEIEDAILIPNAAVYQGAYVYVVKENDGVPILVRRDISVRWRNEEFSLLASGLAPGDRLVITPLGQVTSGTRVRINHPENRS